MLKDQVEKLHEIRQRQQLLATDYEREVDTLVLEALAVEPERELSAADVRAALQSAGFELATGDVLARLVRLADGRRVQRAGLRYRALLPEVLSRQLKETPAKV